MQKSILLENHKISLSQPEKHKAAWTGNPDAVRQLCAAWSVVSKKDSAMTPAIIGRAGIGKTTLARYCATEQLKQNYYSIQATTDTEAEDIGLIRLPGKTGRTILAASPLISAITQGGVFILEDADRLPERTWAALVPLLDGRNWFQTVDPLIRITPHRNFRFGATINDASSVYQLPEYIHTCLTPKISISTPGREDIYNILKENVPDAEKELIEYVTNYMKKSPIAPTISEGINILRFSVKLFSIEKMTPEQAVEESISLNPGLKYREIEKEFTKK